MQIKMQIKWYHKTEMLRWALVIFVTIAIGAFIIMSPWVPDRYRLWVGILDYILFFYANFKIIGLRNLDRQMESKGNENRAARRQAERLKTKQSHKQ